MAARSPRLLPWRHWRTHSTSEREMAASAIVLSALVLLADRDQAVRLGRLDHPAIRECSGIVHSRKHPGIFWVHNDSGNPPALYAVRRDGSLVREFTVA